MSGFFPDNNGGVTLPPSSTESTDTGFFPSAGVPSMLTEPFTGVLKDSTATIGKVEVTNQPGSIQVSNFPAIQRVEVTNPTAIQRVALDFPSVQAVSLDFPAVQTVNGSISINNLPQVQDVRIVASGGLLTALTTGTAHIGSVSIDGPVTGSVTVTNQPTELRVSNFPAVQPVSGTVAVSNFPATPTSIKINNDAGSPIPVMIVDGSYQGGGGSSTFDGNIVLKAGTAHIGSVALDQPVTLASGSTVSVSSLPAITGTVSVSNPVTSVTVTSLPSINGTVSVSNPVSSVSINNGPASPVPVALQGAVNLNGPVSLASGSTVAVSSIPAISGTVSITGTPTVAVQGTVPVNGSVSLSGTPTVAVQGTVPVSGTVAIDTSTPLQVTVTNPSSGETANVVSGNRLYHDIPYATGTTVYDTGIRADVPSPWRSAKIALSLTGATGQGQGTGYGKIKVEGSRDGITYTTIREDNALGSGFGGMGIYDGEAATYWYYRVTVDETGYTPTRSGTITITLDGAAAGIPTTVAQIAVAEGTVGVGQVGIPVMGFNGEMAIPVTLTNLEGTGSVSIDGPVAITGTVKVTTSTSVSPQDRSGTITAGGAAQTMAPDFSVRRGAWVQNNSTGDLWVCDVSTATIGGLSLRIPPGALYEWPAHGVPMGVISIIGSTTGQSYAAREW